MQQVRVNTRLSFGSAQPSNVAQFSVGALTYIAKGSKLDIGQGLGYFSHRKADGQVFG